MNPLRAISSLLLGTACLFAVLLASCHGPKAEDDEAETKSSAAPAIDTTAHIVHEVCRTSRLYTSEFVIHKIVTHSDAPTLEGTVLGIPVKMSTRIGSRKVAIPIDMTLKAYIDFSSFGPQNVTRTAKGIVITLPDPQITATASRVDHEGTRQYIDPMRSRYSDEELSQLARQGADSIMAHTDGLTIVEQARRSAAFAIMPVLRRMGYGEEQITIRFRKDFTNDDIIQLIKQ